MNYFVGIDVGSTQTKGVLINERKEIIEKNLIDTAVDLTKTAEKMLNSLVDLSKIEKKHIKFIVGTGYGRYKVTFGNVQVTEIACHAKGANFLFPNTKTVIDIGGQDTKVIRAGENGEVIDFSMNDKCAAGTGRFLSAAADILNLTLSEIGPISLKSSKPVKLTSVCTVFVESEILSYIARAKKVEDILRGVHISIANRTLSLAKRVGINKEITFTGGVSRNIGMVKALEEKLGTNINTSDLTHFAGAIGASLYALEKHNILMAKS